MNIWKFAAQSVNLYFGNGLSVICLFNFVLLYVRKKMYNYSSDIILEKCFQKHNFIVFIMFLLMQSFYALCIFVIRSKFGLRFIYKYITHRFSKMVIKIAMQISLILIVVRLSKLLVLYNVLCMWILVWKCILCCII